MTDVASPPAQHDDVRTDHFLDDDIAAMLAEGLLGPAPSTARTPAPSTGDWLPSSLPATARWPLSTSALAAAKTLDYSDAVDVQTPVVQTPVVSDAVVSDAENERVELVVDFEIVAPGPATDRLHYLMCAIVGAVGLVLRVVNLAAVGLNSDEAVYAGQGGALLGVGELDQHFSIFRAHPLLLQFVSGAVFHVTGPSDLAVRTVVSVFFGLGCPSAVESACK